MSSHQDIHQRRARIPMDTWILKSGEPSIEGSSSKHMVTDFITDRSPRPNKPRVIEHPAKSNKHRDEYRYCHPNCPQGAANGVTTFHELKNTINSWISDDMDVTHHAHEVTLSPELSEDILRKCVVESEETLQDMRLVFAFHSGPDLDPCDSVTYCNVKQYKVVIFDVKKQMFLLRTSHSKAHCKKTKYLAKIDVHSFDPEWCVDRSTFLAQHNFWRRLREVINSM